MDREWREELEELMENHLPSLFLLRQVASEPEEEGSGIDEAANGTLLWGGREVFMTSSLCKLLQVHTTAMYKCLICEVYLGVYMYLCCVWRFVVTALCM